MSKQLPTETEAAIIAALVDQCEVEHEVDDIEPDWLLFDIGGTKLSSVGLDSLATLELIVFISRKYSINMEEAPKTAWTTISTLAAYIDGTPPT